MFIHQTSSNEIEFTRAGDQPEEPYGSAGMDDGFRLDSSIDGQIDSADSPLMFSDVLEIFGLLQSHPAQICRHG